MKILPGRGALRALLSLAAILALALGVASLPWRAERAAAPPRVVAAARGAGPLRAGAAAVAFDLPAGVPIGGFARWSYASEGVRDAVGARALVLAEPGCKVALASADILLVPEALEGAVRARVTDLGLDGLVLAATHTHAGPGGYWEHAAGERIATGPYDPHVRDLVAGAIADAIRRADGALAPARVAVARGTARDLSRSRSGGARDGRFTVVRVDREGGAPVAELVVFAAHPTLLGMANRKISADWIGPFLAEGRHGTRLLLQGALGDQSAAGPAATSPEPFAAALSARVDALSPPAAAAAPELAFAAVEVGLPSPDVGAAPPLLRRAARNLAYGAFPPTARVEAVRIGDLVLATVPAEPVAAVATRWRASLPAGTEIVSLADGYLGYVEEPARMAARGGETDRTYFGPDLARRLGEAVKLGADLVARPAGSRAP
ncbi:MAG TPA: neutral/alkaline non-lysosomal ceramidase N-terminal domain-containing protein [Anaeromyxobacter sp.]